MGSTLKERICISEVNAFLSMVIPIVEGLCGPGEMNRMSQKSFALVKMAGKHGCTH